MPATYQGPHAAVRQQFTITPGAVAIEDLPPTVVATAFGVFAKENLGSGYGIVDQELAWGADKAVYGSDVIDQRAFDFYPATVFAASPFGNIDLEAIASELASTGYTLDKDKDYDVPETGAEVGQSAAVIPYYKKVGTGVAKILAEDLNTVIIPGGAVVSAQIKPGQKVIVKSVTLHATDYTYIGTVSSIGSDETKVNLAVPFATPFDDATEIAIGTTNEGVAIGAQITGTLVDMPDTLYDPNANFVVAKVAVGDVVYISSPSLSGSETTPVKVSILSIINETTLRFNGEELTAGQIDYNFLEYYPQGANFAEPGSTINLSSYSIKRFVGFSENYGLKLLNAGVGIGAAGITKDSDTQLTVTDVAMPTLSAGDPFILTDANVAGGTDERDKSDIYINLVKTVLRDGTDLIITCETAIRSSETGNPIYTGNEYISAWHPRVDADVLADFRAVRDEENKVVKRIASTEDIFNAWVRDGEESISVYNELAYMAFIEFTRSGGKVCYGINVDATSAGLAGEYTAALEELKLYDLYSHCFGTTDGGVNGLMVPYCLDQADPYEGHERIGVVCYDEEDAYLMGADTGSMDSGGIVTIDGAFNLITAGITVGDKVACYDGGVYIATATMTETPTTPTAAQTDYTGSDYGDFDSFRFLSGRKADQAVRVGNLGMGERRVAVVWPGWFYGNVGDDRLLLPPYYIAATIAGMDAGLIASQSFTNLPFSIPGISNISLNTNTYFRKAQLDVIGGGGIDIIIQDATITQSVKSRHDLTSNMDAVEFRERSITKQADVAAKTIRNAVAPYIGRYNITRQLFQFLGQVCSIVCTKLVKEGILSRLTVTSIKRDEVIADKINFFLEATVFVAGNYYDITLLVKSR